MYCGQFWTVIGVATFVTVAAHGNLPYQRPLYPHWIDEDSDCQDTRQEILVSTSITDVQFKDPEQCTVTEGMWFDPYSGEILFAAHKIDIDHIVPLKAAHELGASSWTREMRREFANDPVNLLAVSATLNRQKGGKTPNEWMPPYGTFHCDYLAKWTAITEKYKLKLEKSRGKATWIKNMLAACKPSEIRQPASLSQ